MLTYRLRPPMHLTSSRMDGQHAGAVNGAGLERLQGAVRLSKRKSLRAGPNGNGRRLTQEIESVLTGIGSHAANDPLSKEITIILKRWNGAHMDPCQRQGPASFQGPQGRNHQLSGWSEH